MIRFALRCPGCDEGFVARVGADSTSGTRFYFPCPYCGLPTRAFAQGQGPDDFRVTFAEASQLRLEDLPEDAKVITANPFVPAKRDADSTSPQVAMSMATLLFLLGDDAVEFLSNLREGEENAAKYWPAIRRTYEYFLEERWAQFDKSFASSIAGSWDLPRGSSPHERANRAHGPLLAILASIAAPSESATRFMSRHSKKHSAALGRASYRDFLINDEAAGKIAPLQRATFDLADLFVSRREMWTMGGLRRAVGSERSDRLDELSLPRDEFGETRDLYQQGFEVICKSLRYLVAAQNTVKRGAPEDFGDQHPDTVPLKSRPKSLAQFDKLPNAYKIAYVGQVPGWEVIADSLDNRIRNTIGHATARHDLRSGHIISDRSRDGVPYLSFLADVFDLFVVLSLSFQVLRFARIAGQGDLG